MRVRYVYDLLSREGEFLGELEGVEAGSGTLSRSASASVKASASLHLVDLGQVSDWSQVRIMPRVEIDDEEWTLGVFIPDVPSRAYSASRREMDVTLLDKCQILEGDNFGETYGAPAGINITDTVKQIIASTGEPAIGIEDSAATLRTGIEWEPTDSKLKIANDLLTAGNFFSLHTSGSGAFVAAPYVRPADRAPSAEYVDGEDVEIVGRYAPDFTSDYDIGDVPNRVVAISQTDEDTEALRAVATNNNPDSPFSYQRLGFYRTVTETDVETASQNALNAYAERRLVELSSPQETVTIKCLPSHVTINDTVRFQSVRHGIDGLWSVTKQEWPLVYNGMVTTTLQRAVTV